MSENSSALTWLIDWDRADRVSGMRSVTPPGWIPVPWMVAPLSRHAASMRVTFRSPAKNQLSGVTTFFPEASSLATRSGSAMTGA